MTTCLHWDHICIPDRCRCWPFHMSDRRRGLLTSCRHLGNIGRRGLGGRLRRNPWGGFVSQMLSDHSFSYMDLPLSGGLETSLHLQKGKIWYLLRNEIWTWPLNTNSTLCYFFMYFFLADFMINTVNITWQSGRSTWIILGNKYLLSKN